MGPMKCVGILLPASVSYLISILAVMKIGGVFLPMNPEWPIREMQRIVAEAHISLVISDPLHIKALEKASLDLAFVMVGSLPNARSIKATDLRAKEIYIADNDGDGHPCYMMFSSGSTGVAKGVSGTERGILNRCHWMSTFHPWHPSDRVAWTTQPTFVDSIWQIFGPLLADVSLVILPRSAVHQPKVLWEMMTKMRVTHMVTIPSLLQSWFGYLDREESKRVWHHPLSLKIIISSGEPLIEDTAKMVRKHVPDHCRFLNLYGCTEAAGDSTCFEISPDVSLKPPASAIGESLPLGHPISHSCVFLLEPVSEQNDGRLNRLGCGGSSQTMAQEIGEICVGGWGLCDESGMSPSSHSTSAFIQCSSQSLQRSVEEGRGICSNDWWPTESKVTLFRTGDLGCITSTGLLWFCGRLDHRVKISGKFVHLLEIERTLKKLKSVVDAAAVHWEHNLFIYIIASVDLKQDDEAALREEIRKRLRMDFSVNVSLDHHHIIFVDRFPRSDSGKVVRHQLPFPETVPKSSIYAACTVNEADVLCAFRNVLGEEMLEPTDDFFYSGGDSIMMAEVADLLQIHPLLVQAYPTARKLAASLRGVPTVPVDAEAPHAPPTHVTCIRDGRCSYQLTAISAEESPSQETRRDKDEGHGVLSRKRRKWTSMANDVPKQGTMFTVHDLRPCETRVPIPEVSLKKNLQQWKTHDPSSQPHCRIIHPYQNCRIVTPAGEFSEPLPHSPETVIKEDHPVLSTKWSGKMHECVDGPLTVLCFSTSPFNHSAPSEIQHFAVVLASCHGGGVACFDERTGYRHWMANVNGRAALGVMVSRDLDVWVPTSDAYVHILALEDGEEKGQIRLSSPIRTSLVMDPWKGALWAALDDSTLTLFLNMREQLSIKTSGVSSAFPCFHAELRLVCYATLSGHVIILGISDDGLDFSKQTAYKAKDPIFSAPQWMGNEVLFPTVEGRLHCLSKTGAYAWSMDLHDRIFAPVTLVKREDDWLILIVTQSGKLILMENTKQSILLTVHIYSDSISRSPSIWLCDPPDAASAFWIFLVSHSQMLFCLKVHDAKERYEVGLYGAYMLPNEAFSPLIILSTCLLLGCRDSQVHCLALQHHWPV